MTYQAAYQKAAAEFNSRGIETPKLDAAVLLAHAAGYTKEQLYIHFPDPLPHARGQVFADFLKQRLDGLPVSYIIGIKPFYDLEFKVDKRVLVPRPDTETIIEAALEILSTHTDIKHVHDVGTGSGCIAISLKNLRPDLMVSASDISPETGTVFQQNCQHNNVKKLDFILSDLLEDVSFTNKCIVVSNPPYLTPEETLHMKTKGWPEPALALDGGGPEGLAVISTLIQQAAKSLPSCSWLLLEAAPWQMKKIRKIMTEEGLFDIFIKEDLAGRDRVIGALQR